MMIQLCDTNGLASNVSRTIMNKTFFSKIKWIHHNKINNHVNLTKPTKLNNNLIKNNKILRNILKHWKNGHLMTLRNFSVVFGI